MNEIAKRNTTDVSTQTQNPFTAYGEAATHRNIVGELLKFSKGDWMAGQDNADVPIGTQFVANMDELLIGWIRWADNKPTDHIMGKVAEGYQPPRRNELGDMVESEWEVGDDGRARDPWQLSNYLLLKDFQEGDLYTFTTGSKGGRDAIGDLCKEYGKVMAQHADEYPVVAIGSDSYPHPNKSFGRIKIPTFEIVGWIGKATFEADLGEVAEEVVPEPEPAVTKLPPRPSPVAAKKPVGRI